jgi:hypothetical protein
LCEEKNIPYISVPKKEELGKAAGLSVPTTAIAIVEAGDAKKAIEDLVKSGSAPVAKGKEADKKEEKKEDKPAKEEKAAEEPKEDKKPDKEDKKPEKEDKPAEKTEEKKE